MIEALHDMKKAHEHLVCIDSDGCVFDNMELKHKECFCPATVNVWGLQGVSRYARQVWEFVNLYSKTRGTNRFHAIVRALRLLGGHPGAVQRGWAPPNLAPLEKWIAGTPALSADALRRLAEREALPPVLDTALQWSNEVDANIAHIVRGKLDFPHVGGVLAQLHGRADIVIVSATPHEAIVREWGAHGLDRFVTVIAGQEMGTKAQCIRAAVQGRYAPDNVLMVGDAPGDHAAAQENGVHFYPIVPGAESESWQRLGGEAGGKFLQGGYGGSYQAARLAEFDAALLENPSWL